MLFAIGLTVGSMTAGPLVAAPPAVPGYVVMSADLHVHSFPGDGALTPWSIAREASRRGLDVIALTNHNAMWSWRLAHALGWTGGGALLLPGVEVTAPHFHVATVAMRAPVDWRGTVADVVARVHAQGGLAIGAHPTVPRASAYDAAAFRALDGIESVSPEGEDLSPRRDPMPEMYRLAVEQHPGIAPIGSSDFHFFAPIGVSRTYVFARERTADSFEEALRAGRTVACDPDGLMKGQAALVAIVRGACAAAGAAAVRRTGTPAAWLAWLALAALVLADRRMKGEAR